MNIRSTKILLSILHICILGICVLTIYSSITSENAVTHVPVSSTQVVFSPPEAPEIETETPPEAEPSAETVPEAEPETEMKAEAEMGPEEEIVPAYSFRSLGIISNVNIRNTPSLNGKIIGKIPLRGEGIVLELTNDEWALIEYNGVIGYSSRKWIKLQEIEQ